MCSHSTLAALWAFLRGTPTQYGACQMVVDFKAKKAMPRPAIRGMIARTYFYMSDRYKLKISDQDRKLFKAWNPVKPWEAQRNQLVSCRMG